MTATGVTAISITSLVVSIVSALAGWGRWRITHHQIRTQNLLQVSNYLHQSEYREAREKVRTSPQNNLDMDSVRKVCSSFDLAGLFVKNRLIKRKVFLGYWKPLLLFLDGHLKEIRGTTVFGTVTYADYYAHFFWLIDQAKA